MYTNLLWTSTEYHSSENCIVFRDRHKAIVRSTLVGASDNKIYHVNYLIETDEQWTTRVCEINAHVGTAAERYMLQHDGKGTWLQNGELAEQLQGCMDVDIPVTPFTNTLPVNRCRLHIHESLVIDVVYIDILNKKISAVKQKYTRLSDNKYRYENVPSDFEAILTVDDEGLVVDYPGLFERVAISQ